MVFDRVGRVYCCALVLIWGMVGTVVGAMYAEEGPGLLELPGCRLLGTVLAWPGFIKWAL